MPGEPMVKLQPGTKYCQVTIDNGQRMVCIQRNGWLLMLPVEQSGTAHIMADEYDRIMSAHK